MSDTAATIDAPSEEPNWLVQFLDKLRGALRGKVDAADYDAALKTARSSVGGLAKAHKAKTSKSASDLPACDLRPWSFADPAASHPGLFVGLFLDPASAQALALDGGQPADTLHITLYYQDDFQPDDLTFARIVARIADSCSWRTPLVGTIAGWLRFAAEPGSDAMDAFCAAPDVPGLEDLQSAVKSTICDVLMAYPEMRGEHGFLPHVTLAMVPSSDPNPVETLPDAALRFDGVAIVYGDKTITVPFRGGMGYAYGEFAVAEGDHGPRLFAEVVFAEPPKRVAILPVPGTYAHRDYGSVEMTADRVARFVKNHNDGVYGQDLPIQIDGGHDLKLSGAMGWLGKAQIEADGSATAEVTWNPRGEQLIREDRVKYLSPEWWDTWTDGATGTAYDDVLIGLALTNRPFFKNAYLNPVAAEEPAALVFATEGDLPDACFAYVPDDAKGKDGSKSLRKLRLCDLDGQVDAGIVGAAKAAFGKGYRGNKVDIPGSARSGVLARINAAARKVGVPEIDDKGNPKETEEPMSDPVQMTEETVKAMVEAAEERVKQAYETRIAATEFEAKQAKEEAARLSDLAQTKTFTDWTQGRGGATDGARWYVTDKATAENHVGFLKKLSRAFGEDSEEVAFYRDYAAQVGVIVKAASEGSFVPVGTDARGETGDKKARADALARTFVESGTEPTIEKARVRVYHEHPELVEHGG